MCCIILNLNIVITLYLVIECNMHYNWLKQDMIAMTTQNTVNFITVQQNILQFCIAQYITVQYS